MKRKVFVGRENELALFRQTLEKLQASQPEAAAYANTFLVYGVGGMGKTALCKRFLEIVEGEFPQLTPLCIDWDRCKNPGSTFTPEELLDTVAGELKRHFVREMKPYGSAKEGIKKVQENIERLLEQKRQTLDTVAKIAGAVAAGTTQNPISGEVVTMGLNLVGRGLSALDEKYLKERAGVGDDMLQLYRDPASGLADTLLDCIRKITAKKKRQLVLMLDTCEWIVPSEEWFMSRFLIPLVEKNPHLVLVFSGRHNPYSQRTVTIEGRSHLIRGMGDYLSHPPQRIDMQVFSRQDIEKYLKKTGCEESGEPVIRFVQTFSRGVPFAVDLLGNALVRLGAEAVKEGFGDPDFEKSLRAEASNEGVIRQVSERFIKYCLDGPENRLDRNRIFGLAVLEDTAPGVLQAVWGVANTADILEELEARYALFIGGGKLHDVVQDFLQDYLLERKNLLEEIAVPLAQKALPIYEQKFCRECETEPVWEDRFREDLWRQALLRLMNAMVWVSADGAVDFFMARSLELFLFNPELVHKLYQPFKKFLAADKELHQTNRRRLNALIEAVDNFSWYDWFDTDRGKHGRVIDFCRGALDNWKPEPLHRSLVGLIMGRCYYHLKDNEAALQTLLEQVDGTPLEKSGQDKLAAALNDVGERFSVDENNRFFFSPQALKAFDRAVQLNRRKASYLYHLGAMTILGGNPRQALPYYHEALKLDPKDKYILHGLRNVYDDLGDHEKAIDMYKKAIDIDPKLAGPYNGLGYIFLNLGRFEEAIVLFRKSIALQPNIGCCVNLGIALYCLDDPQKGVEAFEKGLSCAVTAGSPGIHYQLHKVSALVGSEKIDAALDLVTHIAEKQPPAHFLKQFFSDIDLLAAAPRPPRGIHDFIRRARERLQCKLQNSQQPTANEIL
jgi:tetratricopeptide (TPR) repeat protein